MLLILTAEAPLSVSSSPFTEPDIITGNRIQTYFLTLIAFTPLFCVLVILPVLKYGDQRIAELRSAEINTEAVLTAELESVAERIKYLHILEEDELLTNLKAMTGDASFFLSVMAKNSTQEKSLELAKDILKLKNRQNGFFKYYLLKPNGTALIFPPDSTLENSDISGYTTVEGNKLFSDILLSAKNRYSAVLSYSLRTASAGIISERKKLFFMYNKHANLIVAVEADYDKFEEEAKKNVLDELRRQYLLYPMKQRINILKYITKSGEKYITGTVMDETLSENPASYTETAKEIASVIKREKEPVKHLRKDLTVTGQYSQAITSYINYYPWNWIITKSVFIAPEKYSQEDNLRKKTYSQILTALAAVGLVFMLMIILLASDTEKTVKKCLRPWKRKEKRLQNFLLSLQKAIDNTEKQNSLTEKNNLLLHKTLEKKTAELKGLNEFLIAENMDRTQKDFFLRAETEKAEVANLTKQEFLTNTSEKLKTMVSAINSLAVKGYSEFESMSREEVHDVFGRIHSGGTELMSFLGLIMELSKLEAGKTDDKIAVVDFVELLTRLSHETIPLFAQNTCRLLIDFPAEPVVIKTKCRHTEQALLHFFTYIAKTCQCNTAITVKCGAGKTLRRGEITDSVSIEFEPDKECNLFTDPDFAAADRKSSASGDSSDTAQINLSIFKEALRKINGNFTSLNNKNVVSAAVVIPNLGDSREN
jgi:hypothetical protein